MSTGSGWSYEPKNLREALARFRAREPNEETRRAVYDWLIACHRDPTRRGKEDPTRPEDGRIFIVDFTAVDQGYA